MLHVPHRYLDFTRVTEIARADVGTDATIVATVDRVELKRPRPRMQIVELSVIDETGVLVATFFRQPWIAEQVHVGDRVALSGKVEFSYGFKRMKAPFHEVLGPAAGAGGYARVLPVHPVGEGITASWMRRIVAAALADVGDVCDWLPAGLVARRGLMTRRPRASRGALPHVRRGGGARPAAPCLRRAPLPAAHAALPPERGARRRGAGLACDRGAAHGRPSRRAALLAHRRAARRRRPDPGRHGRAARDEPAASGRRRHRQNRRRRRGARRRGRHRDAGGRHGAHLRPRPAVRREARPRP